MRSKKILGLTFLAMIMLTTIPAVLAPPCLPGRSPGYWKHQCKVAIEGRGRLHEPDIETWADQTSAGSIQAAYDIFTTGNNRDGHKTDLANEFNGLALYGQYIDD